MISFLFGRCWSRLTSAPTSSWFLPSRPQWRSRDEIFSFVFFLVFSSLANLSAKRTTHAYIHDVDVVSSSQHKIMNWIPPIKGGGSMMLESFPSGFTRYMLKCVYINICIYIYLRLYPNILKILWFPVIMLDSNLSCISLFSLAIFNYIIGLLCIALHTQKHILI